MTIFVLGGSHVRSVYFKTILLVAAVTVIFARPVFTVDLYEGNECSLKNGDSGVCKKLKYCKDALSAITSHQQTPVICRFVGHEPVVCCPSLSPQNALNTSSTSNTAESQPSTLPFSTTTITTIATVLKRTTVRPKNNSDSFKDDDDVTPFPNLLRTTTVKFRDTITVASVQQQTEVSGHSKVPEISTESKSAKMCKKYSESVYVDIVIPPQLLGDKERIKRKIICNPIQTLIVGGIEAQPKEFPHMALIGYGNKLQSADWMCGGALISEKYVLSAAHCSDTQRGPAKWIRLGDLNIESDNDDAKPENFEIVSRIRHPRYFRPQLYNDIALFKLDREVTFSVYIKPICLNTDPRLDVPSAVATGWGKLETDGLRSETLMKVTLPMVNPQTCNISFYNNIGSRLPRGIDPELMMCAGEEAGGKDTCQGDSGGPLQIINYSFQCMYTQIGITSFGRRCAAPNSPAVYTRISNYVQWIEDIVWPD